MCRIISSNQAPNYTLAPYVTQTVLLLVAPALFAASIYMTLDKIAQFVDGEHCLVIRRRWLTWTFVGGDVAAFVLQGSGEHSIIVLISILLRPRCFVVVADQLMCVQVAAF